MEQLTGMAWVTGYDDGPPIIPGGVVDPMVGTHAALALVAALEHRDRTGDGQLVEMPMIEVATAVTAEQVIRYSIDGTLLERRGEGGVYRCAGDDAWVAVDLVHDPMPPDSARDVVRDPRRRRRGRDAARAGVPAAAGRARRTRRSTIRSCARAGFFEPIEHPLRRHAASTRRGRCASPAGPHTLVDRRPRRRSASTPTRCCARARMYEAELAPARRARDRHRARTCRPRVSEMLRPHEPGRARRVEDALVDGDVPTSGAPRRPRYAIATSASSTSARSVEHRHVDAERRARRVRA